MGLRLHHLLVHNSVWFKLVSLSPTAKFVLHMWEWLHVWLTGGLLKPYHVVSRQWTSCPLRQEPGVCLSSCSLYFLYCHLPSSRVKFGSRGFALLQGQWQRSLLNKSHALLSFWHCSSFTKAVWKVQGTDLLVPTPLDKRVWCSTLLEGLTSTSGTNSSGKCFQCGGATWPGTSLDPESVVTVLVWYRIQANDSL